MISKKVQCLKVTDAKMIDAMVSCFAILVCNLIVLRVNQLCYAAVSISVFGHADGKGFTCQQCGLIRSKEEVKRIAMEVRTNLDKAPKSSSSGSILFCCSCSKLLWAFNSIGLFLTFLPKFASDSHDLSKCYFL